MSLFSLALPYLAPLLGIGQAQKAGAAAGQAGDVAAGMTEEMRALLTLLAGQQEQYGGPMLDLGWEFASQPGVSRWDLQRKARGDEWINQAYQDVFAERMGGLSERGMLGGDPSSVTGQTVTGTDRARQSALADWATSFQDPNELMRRLQAFAGLLQGQTAGGIGLAGAYDPSITRFTDLARDTGAGQYGPLAEIIKLFATQATKKKTAGTSTAGPGPDLRRGDYSAGGRPS